MTSRSRPPAHLSTPALGFNNSHNNINHNNNNTSTGNKNCQEAALSRKRPSLSPIRQKPKPHHHDAIFVPTAATSFREVRKTMSQENNNQSVTVKAENRFLAPPDLLIIKREKIERTCEKLNLSNNSVAKNDSQKIDANFAVSYDSRKPSVKADGSISYVTHGKNSALENVESKFFKTLQKNLANFESVSKRKGLEDVVKTERFSPDLVADDGHLSQDANKEVQADVKQVIAEDSIEAVVKSAGVFSIPSSDATRLAKHLKEAAYRYDALILSCKVILLPNES